MAGSWQQDEMRRNFSTDGFRRTLIRLKGHIVFFLKIYVVCNVVHWPPRHMAAANLWNPFANITISPEKAMQYTKQSAAKKYGKKCGNAALRNNHFFESSILCRFDDDKVAYLVRKCLPLSISSRLMLCRLLQIPQKRLLGCQCVLHEKKERKNPMPIQLHVCGSSWNVLFVWLILEWLHFFGAVTRWRHFCMFWHVDENFWVLLTADDDHYGF